MDSNFRTIFYNESNYLEIFNMNEDLKYNFNQGLFAIKKATQIFPNGSGVYKFLDEKKNNLLQNKETRSPLDSEFFNRVHVQTSEASD